MFIVEGGALDGVGIKAMMIGSCDCVSKGKMKERVYVKRKCGSECNGRQVSKVF